LRHAKLGGLTLGLTLIVVVCRKRGNGQRHDDGNNYHCALP
jgi:hypothetical protein